MPEAVIGRSAPVSGDRCQRHAGTLLLVTSVLWLHQWLPALLVAVWVSWLILHKRLEGDLGEALVRLWRRTWPPRTLVLVPLLAANALAYWVYAPVPGNVMPLALSLLGLSMLLFGNWGRAARSLEPAPEAAFVAPDARRSSRTLRAG